MVFTPSAAAAAAATLVRHAPRGGCSRRRGSFHVNYRRRRRRSPGSRHSSPGSRRRRLLPRITSVRFRGARSRWVLSRSLLLLFFFRNPTGYTKTDPILNPVGGTAAAGVDGDAHGRYSLSTGNQKVKF